MGEIPLRARFSTAAGSNEVSKVLERALDNEADLVGAWCAYFERGLLPEPARSERSAAAPETVSCGLPKPCFAPPAVWICQLGDADLLRV